MSTKFRLLMLPASLIALGFAVAGPAHAEYAYGYAANNVKDGAVFAGVDTNGDGRPDTINNTAIQFGTPSSLSSTAATLNGAGVSNSSSTPPPDAPISATGSAAGRANETLIGPANTYYAPIGIAGTNYSWGDAKVVSEQSASGTPIVARNAAESNVATPGAFADANGTNRSSTRLDLPITVGQDCNTLNCGVSFSFLADPFILASLSAGAAPGSVARGELTFNITLTEVGGLAPLFSWAPNGSTLSGILGGVETADAENLNLTREVLFGGDPDAVHSGPYAADVFGSYFAYTNYLKPGVYTLTLAMTEKSDVKLLVPEPTALALAGLALSALAWTSRRRRQA